MNLPYEMQRKKIQLAECNIKVKGSLPLHLSKVQIKLNLYREWECTFLPKKCRSEREQNFFSSLAKPWCGKRFFFGMREKISFFDLKCQNKFWASFEKDVGCSCNHKCRSRQNNVENLPILYFWTQINLLRECRNWKYQLECKEFENTFAKVNPWNKCLGTKLIWIIFMV